MVERFIATLKTNLQMFVIEHQTEFNQHVTVLLFADSLVVHETIDPLSTNMSVDLSYS